MTSSTTPCSHPLRKTLASAGSLLLLLLLSGPIEAGEDGTPIPKVGSCPAGYWTRGNYCMPMRGNDQEMIIKQESCPAGYWTRGNYCTPMRGTDEEVIPKRGSCPAGYWTRGEYCFKQD